MNIDWHQYYTFNKITWIGDNGLSCIITHNYTNMYEIKKFNKWIILGHVDVTELIMEIYPLKYCPRTTENLFSIRAALSAESKLQSNDTKNLQSRLSIT